MRQIVSSRLRSLSAAIASTACLASVLTASVLLQSCSPEKKESKVFEAGEKAQVDRITYSVVDTQTLPKLDAGGESRVPQDRFYLVQLSLFNGGNTDYAVPTLTLVDEQGKTYPELADGRGVQGWVGVSRKLSPGETLQGTVVFDAPVRHYKLRISDEFAEMPVFVDLPMGFIHENGGGVPSTAQDAQPAPAFTPTPSQSLPSKK